jgi:hypothetical protein
MTNEAPTQHGHIDPRRWPYFIKSGEGWSIAEWWRRHPDPGRLTLEVKLGQLGPASWPNPRSHRRLDVLHRPGVAPHEIRYWQGWGGKSIELRRGADVEIVEAKYTFNHYVVGPCIAGGVMYSRAVPDRGPVSQVASVHGDPDSALRWVCNRRSIAVHTFPE